jgi:tetratricopeptide (TPR) repeat protein
LIWTGLAVGLLILGFAAAQLAPGVPAEWRPVARYRLWQAERLFASGMEAERKGDWATAKVAYLSCLEARPDAPVPRWRIGRRLVLEGDFDGAIAMISPVTADPAAFVHDGLLSAEKHVLLARFAVIGLGREPARRGVWLATLRVALALGRDNEREALEAELNHGRENMPARDAGWLSALWDEVSGRFDRMEAELRGIEAGGAMDASEVLMGVELLLRSGRDADAWVWAQRHRARLGAFDRWFVDWRISLRRDPLEAVGLLRELATAQLDAGRWHRLAAAIFAEKRVEVAEAFEKLSREKSPPASVCVSIWVLLLGLDREEAAQEWAELYQLGAGRPLPILHGRALAGGDREAQWRAALLLAAEAQLPREMVAAVALR